MLPENRIRCKLDAAMLLISLVPTYGNDATMLYGVNLHSVPPQFELNVVPFGCPIFCKLRR